VLALLRTPRWIGFSVLVVVAIIGFGLLSYWQWTRAEDKRAEREQLALLNERTPVALNDATQSWQRVEIRGTFDNASTQLVRQRPLQGLNGFWVLTLLRTSDGSDIWVNRGWTPAGYDARQLPNVPMAPTGAVQLTGSWVPYEVGGQRNVGLPPGMVSRVAVEELPYAASYAGFVHAQQMNPAESLFVPITPPNVSEGQNLSYAFQWLAFAVVASPCVPRCTIRPASRTIIWFALRTVDSR